jgi:hypothetical protein
MGMHSIGAHRRVVNNTQKSIGHNDLSNRPVYKAEGDMLDCYRTLPRRIKGEFVASKKKSPFENVFLLLLLGLLAGAVGGLGVGLFQLRALSQSAAASSSATK